MKYRRLFTVILVSLTILTDISGQQQGAIRKTKPGDINQVEFKLSYNFQVSIKTSKIKFILNLPQTIPHRQEIVEIQCTPKPQRIFQENGNSYAEFIFVKPNKNSSIAINIKANLFKYDLSMAEKDSQDGLYEMRDLDDFLKDEKFIEKDNPMIQAIANTITTDVPLSTVRKIYDYVINNMEYTGYEPRSKGATEAAQLKKGDCTEYSDLFVALCRAKNIPARVVSGYMTKFYQTPKHNWVEVYIKPYGWVPFDPTVGDVKDESTKNERFHNLQPIYIYFSHLRNDAALKNSYLCHYWYYGDPIKIEDSIEFK
jgi:hypothetical protein